MANVVSIKAAAGSSLGYIGTALRVTVISVLVLGFGYPALLTAAGALCFPQAANGSLIRDGGVLRGSELVGQQFTSPRYFHGRPSAAGSGYDPTQTGGTNFGPTNAKLIKQIAAAALALRQENPSAAAQSLPPELVTSSASGIDPDISPQAAEFQAARVARARNLDFSEVRTLIMRYTSPRLLGIFGEPHVNVLNLNRAMDAQERYR